MDVGRLILLTITTTSLLAGQSPISMRPIEFHEAILLLFFKSGSAMHASCKTNTVSAAVYAAVQLCNCSMEHMNGQSRVVCIGSNFSTISQLPSSVSKTKANEKNLRTQKKSAFSFLSLSSLLPLPIIYFPIERRNLNTHRL